jgi:hypothetical protein
LPSLPIPLRVSGPCRIGHKAFRKTLPYLHRAT